MIEKMKKVTLLVPETQRQMVVSKLRKAGVLHISHVKEPLTHEVSFVQDRLSKVNRLISNLSPYYNKDRQKKEGLHHDREVLDCSGKVDGILRDKQVSLDRKEEVKRNLDWYKEWGKYDPRELQVVREKGLNVCLYKLRKKDFVEIEEQSKLCLLKKEKGHYYILLMLEEGEVEPDFTKQEMPENSPQELYAESDELNKKILGIEALLKEKADHLKGIEDCKEKLEKEIEFLQVKFGMKEEGAFSYMQGFCPVKYLDKVLHITKEHGVGYLFEDPSEEEEVPTLITNPAWIRIVAPIFQFMKTVPGYSEFDISPYFLIFFSVFFAMLIGDAGYGALFLIITFLVQRKFKKLPKEPIILMYILSGCTIIWGAITGTWFGIEQITQIPVFKALVIPQINSFSEHSQNVIIFTCFVIGAVHLTVARLLRAMRFINSLVALAEVGWICILWGMFFAAGKFVLGRSFPPVAGGLLFCGILLVLLFTNIRKGFFRGALTTLTDLPLSVIGSFSDIVSYLRLFAVGYASVVVAQSFNNMAIGDGVNSILGGLIAAVILFFGHTLNIILGFMAIIVHGIRLNMLEFSGQLGMQWSGKDYDPFRVKPAKNG